MIIFRHLDRVSTMIPAAGMPVNEIFQALEKYSVNFPMLGKFCPSDIFTFFSQAFIA
jgi:hypothetical protein